MFVSLARFTVSFIPRDSVVNEIFRCQRCAFETAAWRAACEKCGGQFIAVEPAPDDVHDARMAESLPQLRTLAEYEANEVERISSGVSAVDAVTGGGLVVGAAYVMAGAPGAGKSTLALQIGCFASAYDTVFYVSGEEPVDRLAARAVRLRLDSSRIVGVPYTEIGQLTKTIKHHVPRLVIVDSLNAVYSSRIRSRPGSPSQIIGVARALVTLAQSTNAIVLGLAHVTKTNQLSGPRTVEHDVDVMLTFQPSGARRILEATKNRFGPSHQKSTMIMTDRGLI